MKLNKSLSLLSLATKAGKTKSGEFLTEKAVKEGDAYLVIVAADASDNTRKRFQNMCDFYKCELLIYGTKEELGKAIGKEFRASVAVLDENFATAIVKKAALV